MFVFKATFLHNNVYSFLCRPSIPLPIAWIAPSNINFLLYWYQLACNPHIIVCTLGTDIMHSGWPVSSLPACGIGLMEVTTAGTSPVLALLSSSSSILTAPPWPLPSILSIPTSKLLVCFTMLSVTVSLRCTTCSQNNYAQIYFLVDCKLYVCCEFWIPTSTASQKLIRNFLISVIIDRVSSTGGCRGESSPPKQFMKALLPVCAHHFSCH